MKRTQLSAFTLVELLVVIAIIGILVALLLPAVQSARETARRVDCSNRLKQIGLALLKFEDTNKHLPAACAPIYDKSHSNMNSFHDALGGRGGWSWFVELLPYIEQQMLHDRWDFNRNLLANQSLATTDIPNLYCPSRRASVGGDEARTFENWTSGGNDYGACIGWGNAFHDDFDLSYTEPCVHSYSDVPKIYRWNEGQVFEANAPPNTAGMFTQYEQLELRQVTDGLSKTILVGEVQRYAGDQWRELGLASTCHNMSYDGWALSGVATLFNVQLGEINSGHYEHPGSEHPGGANFGLADGSVQFIRAEISPRSVRMLASYNDGTFFDVDY